MKKFLFNIMFCFFSLLISCDKDDSGIIDPSIPFYQSLAVEYNVTQHVTRIGANFNKKDKEGANLRLPEKGILFNGEVPTFLGMGYYMYMLSKPGLIPVTFTFNRWKNQVYTNQVSINDVLPIGIPDTFLTIHNQKMTIINWEGAPIGEDEFIQVHLTYNGGVYDTNIDLEGTRNIAFHFSNLTSATKGILYLSRVKKLPLQESNGNAGGNIQVSYVQNKEIEFK